MISRLSLLVWVIGLMKERIRSFPIYLLTTPICVFPPSSQEHRIQNNTYKTKRSVKGGVCSLTLLDSSPDVRHHGNFDQGHEECEFLPEAEVFWSCILAWVALV